MQSTCINHVTGLLQEKTGCYTSTNTVTKKTETAYLGWRDLHSEGVLELIETRWRGFSLVVARTLNGLATFEYFVPV